MSRWFSERAPVVLIKSPKQAGLAMVISLILLLVITLMGMGVAYVASVQSELVAAVTNKPLSMDAGETCFDNAIEWLSTPSGQSWVNGLGDAYDLAATAGPLKGKTVLGDTIPLGQSDNRSAKFKDRLGRATYTSCIVQKISSSTNGNTGNEIGTSNGYGVSSFVYVIRITSVGNYDAPMSGSVINPLFWQSNSSRTVLEAVVQYTP
jgi:Tfp pilus assembly protein PilX